MQNLLQTFLMMLFVTSLSISMISCDKEDANEISDMMDQIDDMKDDDGMGKMDDQADGDGTKNDDPVDDGSADNSSSGNAPDFTLTSVDGGSVSLSNFKGKPVVIFFFGSTCPLCVASAPKVESTINQKFTSDQIAMIGVDTWNGSQSAVQSFRNSTKITFDLLLDGSSVQSLYGTTYDRLFLIDADGNVAHEGKSAAGGDAANVATQIEGLLK